MGKQNKFLTMCMLFENNNKLVSKYYKGQEGKSRWLEPNLYYLPFLCGYKVYHLFIHPYSPKIYSNLHFHKTITDCQEGETY